jgi:hypothetical protein
MSATPCLPACSIRRQAAQSSLPDGWAEEEEKQNRGIVVHEGNKRAEEKEKQHQT